jgi:hypothetical protein
MEIVLLTICKGYIARSVPNLDPNGGAELTYEFHPSNGQAPQPLNFLVKTSGLNAYPLTWLMAYVFFLVNCNCPIFSQRDT